MQKVADMTDPLSESDGFAARGSTSINETCL